MYPIRLNLLSTEKRKYLNRMIYVQFIKNTFISIVFVFCLSGITLLGGQLVMQEYFNDVSNNLTISDGMNAEKNIRIQKINTMIKKSGALQEIHNLWSQKIVEVTNSTPNGVIFKNLILNKNNKEINISGIAKNRSDLIELRDNMSNLRFINNVKIPLSQLTEKEDINFSISIEMK